MLPLLGCGEASAQDKSDSGRGEGGAFSIFISSAVAAPEDGRTPGVLRLEDEDADLFPKRPEVAVGPDVELVVGDGGCRKDRFLQRIRGDNL